MAEKERPLYTLYKGLKANNFDVPDNYDSFERTLTEAGNGGANSRHTLYNSLKEQNFDVPDTYERFYSNLFTPVNKNTSRALGGAAPMSAADKARFSSFASGISAQAGQAMRRAKNTQRAAKLKQQQEKQRNDFGRVDLGTRKTPYGTQGAVKDDFGVDPVTGKAGTYITSSGEEIGNEYEAGQQQQAEDKFNDAYNAAVDSGDIPSAFDVVDKDGNYDLYENVGKNGIHVTEQGKVNQLDAKINYANERLADIKARIAEIDSKNGNPLLSYQASIGGGSGASEERRQLGLAKTQVEAELRSLDAVRKQPERNFLQNGWQGFSDTALTAKTWDFGLNDFALMAQMEHIKTKIDNNVPLSNEEKRLAQSKVGADAAAALADKNMGYAYRWSGIAGQSVPFMLDFYLTGGFGGLTHAAGKAAVKYAAKKGMGAFGKNVLKYTGVTAANIVGSYAMAGTEQAFKTGADIMNRHMGTLYQDEDGNYKFGTFDDNGNLIHDGGEGFGTALYKGLTAAMLENYTEKVFRHTHFKRATSKAFAAHFPKFASFLATKGAPKWMKRLGYDGLGEEIMEEEINIPLNSLLVGDNKLSDLGDLQQQCDIIFGIGLSVGAMHAINSALRGAFKIYNSAQYYRFKNAMGNVDSRLQSMMGDRWDAWKDKIDNTPNEKMGALGKEILKQKQSGSLNEEEINTIGDYISNLAKVRGYNLAKTTEVEAKEQTGEETTPEEKQQQEQEQAYAEGQDAEGEEKHEIQMQTAEAEGMLASMLGVSEDQLDSIDLDSMLGENADLDLAIYDYQNSQAKYQGVIDNAQSKVDAAEQNAIAEVKRRTDTSRGTVRNATIKSASNDLNGGEDYGVFIVSGNLAQNEDGTINTSDSDQMILYFDPLTGKIEHSDASRFASLGEEVDAELATQQAIELAKQDAIAGVTRDIDGKIGEGSRFVVTDNQGQQHVYEVLADNGDGTAYISIDGNVMENVFPTIDELQKMKDDSDKQRIANTVATKQAEREKQQAAEEQKKQEAEEKVNTIDFSKLIDPNGTITAATIEGEEDKLGFVVGYTPSGKLRIAYLNEDGTVEKRKGLVSPDKVMQGEPMAVDEYKTLMGEQFASQSTNSEVVDESATKEVEGSGLVDEAHIEDDEPSVSPITDEEADAIIADMENRAEPAADIPLTPENWEKEFGEEGTVQTPIGVVKMGENQVAKLFFKGREAQLGMIKPTLENPDAIIEIKSGGKEGEEVERDTKLLFVKTFLNKSGKKIHYFTSVTVRKEGMEVSISNHIETEKRIRKFLKEGKLLYRVYGGAQTEQTQPSASVTTSHEGSAGSSEGKDNKNPSNDNEEKQTLTFADGTPVPMLEDGNPDFAKMTAEQAAELYDSQFGEDAEQILSNSVADAKKVLDKAKGKPIKGKTFLELKASKDANGKAVADAQAAYDNAKAVSNAYQEMLIDRSLGTADGRQNLLDKAKRKYDRLKNTEEWKDNQQALWDDTVGKVLHRLYDGTSVDVFDPEPRTVEEYVSSNLAPFSLNYEGTKTAKGVKQETGLERKDFAKSKVLAAEGKGLTVDAFVHKLWKNRPPQLDSATDQDIRNAVIGLITGNMNAYDMRHVIENKRIAEAEKEIEDEQTAAENAAYQEEQRRAAEEVAASAEENTPVEEVPKEESASADSDEQQEEQLPEQQLPEDAADNMPFGEQLSESELPLSPNDENKVVGSKERKEMVGKNKVTVDHVSEAFIPKKLQRGIARIAKMMPKVNGKPLTVQYLYSADADGWFDRGTNTLYLALDSSKALQMVFGHEMTHAIKSMNASSYDELKGLVKEFLGEDFDKAVDATEQFYNAHDVTYPNREDYEEEVIADGIGIIINDLNLTKGIALRMSHPLLAAFHNILMKIRLAFRLSDDGTYERLTHAVKVIEKAYVDTAKGTFDSNKGESGERVAFSLREKPEPEKKGIGYKVFLLKDGKLYPPMVANPNGAATPVGVWLDADAAPIAGESKTGRPQVKQGGKGTQGGSGKLAYRPGWHLGVIPYALQFNRKDADGNKTLFPKNFVFAEVEYAADVDYQQEAHDAGVNPSGKYQHSLAGLKHLPTDGYYMYRTNPNPETDPWVITGAMKVNRILTRAEQADLVKKAGREPQLIQDGDIVTDEAVNAINQEIANAPKFSLKVYHGSGADFDEFDFDHMGEGAGSQAFGWGGYVTTSKKIGKSYATLMDNDPSRSHVVIRNGSARRFIKKYPTLESFLHSMADNGNLTTQEKTINKHFTEQEKIDYYNERAKDAEPYHNLYEVDIPEDNGKNYLDWYGKVGQRVINKVAKAIDADETLKERVASWTSNLPDYWVSSDRLNYAFKNMSSTGKRTGQDLYDILHSIHGSDKKASKFLSSLGYTGIKYPAGTIMGGAEKGDTNYVIFKPEDMTIASHTKFSIRTYHGSQASFDKFDHSFMGSGEGAQAYGWGTYVSEVEGIAKAYAKQNAKKNAPSRLMYQGKPMTYKTPTVIYQVALDMDKNNISANEAISKMIDADEKKLASVGDTPFEKMKAKQVQDELNTLKGLNPSDFKINEDYDTVAQNLADVKSGLSLMEDDLKDNKSLVDMYQSRLDEAKEELAKAKESGTGLGVDMYEDDVEYYSRQVEMYKQKAKANEDDIKDIKAKVDALQKKLDSMEKPRNLYTVEIPDDTGDNYIDWDGAITEKQHNAIIELMKSMAYKYEDGYHSGNYGYDIFSDSLEKELFKNNQTGGEWYRQLESVLGSDKLVSKLLQAHGIDGVKVIAQRNSGGNKQGNMNYVIFDENNAKIVNHTKFSLRDIDKVNKDFNDALKDFTLDNADKITFHLGMPSSDLLSGGVANKPLKLYGSKLAKKIRKHDFEPSDLTDLPKAMQHPIAVFNNHDTEGNRSVLTELKIKGDNVLVSVTIGKGQDADINIISSTHGKRKSSVIEWFKKGLATFVNKKKAQEYLHLAAPIAAASNTDELSAAKISNSSETSKENGEKSSSDSDIRFSLRSEQIHSEQFKDWFGDWEKDPKNASKVVDENGEPLVVYHGTTNDETKRIWNEKTKSYDTSHEPFTVFKREVDGLPNSGLFFNSSENNAYEYGYNNYAVYLNAKNPLVIDCKGSLYNSIKHDGKTMDTYDWANWAEENGYDGVIFKNIKDGVDYGSMQDTTDDYVVFNANQIKSATDNNGDFSSKNKDIRFSLKDPDKTMFGMHNISVDKLRKAIKQGGFAAPSMGVVDSNNGIYSDYGEITLIPKAEKLDKRKGKNAGTFTADAWTPTYPQVTLKADKGGMERLNRDTYENENMGDGMGAAMNDMWTLYLDGHGKPTLMSYQFLYETGRKPKLVKYPKEYSSSIVKTLNGIYYKNGRRIWREDYTDEEVGTIIKIYNKWLDDTGKGAPTEEEVKSLVSSFDKDIAGLKDGDYKNSLIAYRDSFKKYRGDKNAAISWMEKVMNAAQKQGKVDSVSTRNMALNKVEESPKLSAEFYKWFESKLKEYGVEEYLYNGETPSGKAKYVPNTVENAVKIMKKQGLAGGYNDFAPGVGAFIAKYAPTANTLAAMKKSKDKLIPSGDERHKEVRDMILNEYNNLARRLTIKPNDAFDDSGTYRMQELADVKPKDLKKYIADNWNKEVSDGWVERYNELVDTIKNDYPVYYFETKFMRPYGLDEFEKAIVPKNTPKDVMDALKNAGIDVRTYEGKEDRGKVTMDAINDSDDIKFSIRTYHGTGAKFDSFDLSHAFEGDGSETFGHGVYVTNSKEIGSDYAKRAKDKKTMFGFDFVNPQNMSKQAQDMLRHYMYKHQDVEKGLENARNDLKEVIGKFPDTEYLQELDQILSKDNDSIAIPSDRAYRYDVEIPDDDGHNYLYWFAEPSKEVQERILEGFYALPSSTLDKMAQKDASFRSLLYDIVKNVDKKQAIPALVGSNTLTQKSIYDTADMENNVGSMYRRFSNWFGGADKVSDFLSSLGYTGIKYPAGTIYSGAKEGDYNYVIFNEADAKIVGNTRFSLRQSDYEKSLSDWKKRNGLPKDAKQPEMPQQQPNESKFDYMKRVNRYLGEKALWKTAPTYEGHLLFSDTAVGYLNSELQRGSVLARIAMQDSMLPIRKAQEGIMKELGLDKIGVGEDAYTAENRSHGKGKNEFEEYNQIYLQPLRKAYHAMKKLLGDSYDNVKVYMMSKHGLERNAFIAFREALKKDFTTKEEGKKDVFDASGMQKAYNDYKVDINRINNDADYASGKIDYATYRQNDDAIRTQYAPSYPEYRYDDEGNVRDYAGLSALYSEADDFEIAAAANVKDVEDAHKAEADALWDATNASTKKILKDSYLAGMMSKSVYDYVKGMYNNYIPLRGWDGATADQVWDYVGGGRGAFNQAMKKAGGRKSIADDPIAYIENMAESGILLNNKNWVKQHLLLLAENHPTSMLSVSKAWYVKSRDAQGNEIWTISSPNIPADMTDPQKISQAIAQFDNDMRTLEAMGEATQKRGHLDIVYPQTKGEEREHEVRVLRDGEEYVIYVNGDPQLAQAMNNVRAQRVRENQTGLLERASAWLGRKMAAAYTSLSPLFIPANFTRDLTMTLASTAIREDGRYNYLLRKNFLTHWNTMPLVIKYQNGTLRKKVEDGSATESEKMFYEFMMNGGETGFVSTMEVEDFKKKIQNELKDMDRWKANPKRVGHAIMDSIELLNRAIEDSNRFLVYMTSRQYGRPLEEAINNAKDVTLNFNRKGTGEYGWQMVRNLYLFVNPAIQSLQTLGALAKNHPYKFTAVTSLWLASGALVPVVNSLLLSMFGGDDDKDKYWNFSKWDRRNNFIMWIPYTKNFVKVPLAQEFRGFYAVGDMIASKLMGGEKAEESWSDYASDFAGQVVDMLPLDPTGYDGNVVVSLMPNAVRPIFELAFNVDFTGKPLFNDSDYNKYDPNFTKAYVGTPDWLVRTSKLVNSINNPYPDVQQNAIDRFGNPRYNLNNPAVVDHVLSSYLGGAYTFGSQAVGVLTKALNADSEIKVADIPLLSRFAANPDDRPVSKKQGDAFWTMKEQQDRTANTLSKLKKEAKVSGDFSTLEGFYKSDQYAKFKENAPRIKQYEEDKKKEKAEKDGEEYKAHKLTGSDIYKKHASSSDDFEDMKMDLLWKKVGSYKTVYDGMVSVGNSQSESYYGYHAAAIDAADEAYNLRSDINGLKKGMVTDDGKDGYNADDMKRIRELRKQAISILENAAKSLPKPEDK